MHVLVNAEELSGNFLIEDEHECGPECEAPRVYNLDELWPRCWQRELARPEVLAVRSLYNAMQAQPVAGWPREYPAWLVEGVSWLENAMELKAQAAQRAALGG